MDNEQYGQHSEGAKTLLNQKMIDDIKRSSTLKKDDSLNHADDSLPTSIPLDTIQTPTFPPQAAKRSRRSQTAAG